MRHLVPRCTAPRAAAPLGGPVAVPATGKARIILADHERLVVSYSAQDNTVYVLAPPGGDPRAVLPAARLVLHDDAYRELARHLGVAPSWRVECRARGGRRRDTGETREPAVPVGPPSDFMP
jgi:hypothetical protein